MSTKSTSISSRYVFFNTLRDMPDAWLYPALGDANNRLNNI